ncbi:MAG: HAD family hydrolase [Deltaproteobacteria bacterium]|uniref:D,D-heptose 1,7-bisphosphate phosphatase n=1 Tax=Candidatus Desulfacyla euxinica TaxID=2841693 RepID=A0A8J6N1S8_9DELT|nr:HAD family hydrolase [Candidatus Desulfacyla euxinica]
MNHKPKKAVFLDRDGVINRPVIRDGKPYPPSSVTEVEILPGVSEALEKLKDKGFLLICVTNQPDVARGTQKREQVESIHKCLLESLCLDEILVCYHDDNDGCQCRKPLPGMLLDAAGRLAIDLKKSFMVGDRWRDIEAGQNAGCTTIFIEYGYKERGPKTPPDITVASLAEGADWILRQISV